MLVFKDFLDNRLLRSILRFISGQCRQDNDNRLKIALELMVGKRKDACSICSHLVYPIVRFVINTARRRMGVAREEFMEQFQNSYWLRGLTSTLQGIADYGIQKPFVPGAPYLVVWNFTNKCNLSCKHCYANAGEKAPGELNTEEAMKVVDILSDMGVTVLSFSGGEPLARNDFLKVLKHARNQGMYTAIATNGTLLTEKMSQKLASILPSADEGYVEVSIDGATAEAHDAFRGLPGAFDRAIKGIKNAVDAGMDVAIAPTVTQDNFDEVDEIVALANQLGVWRVIFFNFIPTGRGKEMAKKDLTPRQREELLHKIIQWNNDPKITPEIETTAPQLGRVAYQLAKKGGQENVRIATHMENPEVPADLADIAEFIGGCGAGRFYLALQPNGDISPCVFIEKQIGNIFEDDIQTMWSEHPLFWLLRDKDIPEGCGDCKYRYVCGGCRARSFGYFDSFQKPDIGCIRNEDRWQAYRNEE